MSTLSSKRRSAPTLRALKEADVHHNSSVGEDLVHSSHQRQQGGHAKLATSITRVGLAPARLEPATNVGSRDTSRRTVLRL